MFKFPRFQSPAFARKPAEVNEFSWSLTHPLEPEEPARFWPKLSHCGQGVSLPAGQATSQSVSLPVLTRPTFQ